MRYQITGVILFTLLVSNGFGISIDPDNRWQVRDFYKAVFLTTDLTQPGWTGDYGSGDGGSVSKEWLLATQDRINYFRAMAGVPANVRFDPERNAACQEAALMLSVRGQLSHTPSPDWLWYTEAGAEAARHGNLSLGSTGPQAVDGYISDFGPNNGHVGHRRWLLYPQTDVMGSGDVPGDVDKGWFSSNVTWVIPDEARERPPTRDPYVAWPPRGYVPANLVYSRWSFSCPDADFSETTVSMTRDGVPLPLTMEALSVGQMGDPTIVWVPDGMCTTSRECWELMGPQETIHVQVSHVRIEGSYEDFAYSVAIFDSRLAGGEEIPTTLTATGPVVAGASTSFTSTSRPWSEAIEARVCRTQPVHAAFTAEEALNGWIPQISDGYTPVQDKRVTEGDFAYHLANPDASMQALVIDKEFIVTGPDPTLSFYSSLAWATENQVAAVQVNQGGGSGWESIWEQVGPVEANSAFQQVVIDLSPWMQRSVSFRFIYDAVGGSYYFNTQPEIGWAFDEVNITGVTEIVESRLTSPSPVGTPIELIFQDTEPAYLQAREIAFGGFPLDWGPLQKITPQSPSGISTKLNEWVEDPLLGWNYGAENGWTSILNLGWTYVDAWPWVYTCQGWFYYLSGSVTTTLWLHHPEYGYAYTSLHYGNWFHHEPFAEGDWKQFLP